MREGSRKNPLKGKRNWASVSSSGAGYWFFTMVLTRATVILVKMSWKMQEVVLSLEFEEQM